MMFPLTAINIEAGTQVRAAINMDAVLAFAERMQAGDVFPPIVLFHDGTTYVLADGFHRYRAALRIGAHEIAADVTVGTREDALWYAIGANHEHGQRMTLADKTQAIKLALRAWPEKMQREIAQHVGCSESLVSKTALRLTKNTGGETVLRGRALAMKKTRDEVRARVMAGESSTAIRREVKAHSTIIADVRRELGLRSIDSSRAAVTERRARMREMARAGHSSRQIAAEVGMSEEQCRDVLRKDGIEVYADTLTRGTHRHDSNRLLARIVADAEGLTDGANLIVFSDLDADELGGWVKSLTQSRAKLGALIQRVKEEQLRNDDHRTAGKGEADQVARQSSPVEDPARPDRTDESPNGVPDAAPV